MFGKFTIVISVKIYVTTLSSIVDIYSHTSRRDCATGGGGGDDGAKCMHLEPFHTHNIFCIHENASWLRRV